MRLSVTLTFFALLAGCSIRTSGLRAEGYRDAARDGASMDARADGRIPDAGTDACLGCECRTAADCAPARIEHTECTPSASPTGPCDTSGTRQRIEISYLCNAGACRENRNMFGEPCMVPTDGAPCGLEVVGDWSACTTSDCSETGAETRVVTTPVCMGGTCGATMRTESRPCSVDTDGRLCSGTASCRGRCRSGSCDLAECSRGSDCDGLCESGFRYCVACCLCS